MENKLANLEARLINLENMLAQMQQTETQNKPFVRLSPKFINKLRPALEEGGPLLFTDRQILLGAGKNNQTFVVNQARQPAIESSVMPSVDGKGYTLEAAIPWTALAVAPKEGQPLLFDLAVGNSADGKQRISQLVWNGGPRDSSDRSAWGHLTLVP